MKRYAFVILCGDNGYDDVMEGSWDNHSDSLENAIETYKSLYGEIPKSPEADYMNTHLHFVEFDVADGETDEMTLFEDAMNGTRVLSYQTGRKCQNKIEKMYRQSRGEAAMQAGMAFGCDGYNDFWGY